MYAAASSEGGIRDVHARSEWQHEAYLIAAVVVVSPINGIQQKEKS
jgi:hypothetical protein